MKHTHYEKNLIEFFDTISPNCDISAQAKKFCNTFTNVCELCFFYQGNINPKINIDHSVCGAHNLNIELIFGYYKYISREKTINKILNP